MRYFLILLGVIGILVSGVSGNTFQSLAFLIAGAICLAVGMATHDIVAAINGFRGKEGQKKA